MNEQENSPSADVSNALLGIGDVMDPLRSWAKGYRDALIADGWTATRAEHIAAEALILLLKKAMQ